MHAQIHDKFESLNETDDGRTAVAEYIGAVIRGLGHAQAEIVASNVLQRAGHNVNASGGASFRVASIEHNEIAARVSLTIDRDERGHFVATDCDEDTGARFKTAEEAFESISQRWGADAWALELAAE